MGDKKFDVVVYGATGYTGKLVVDYMVSNYGKAENLKWAIAGRNEAKLKSVKEAFKLSESIEAIVVDSNDQDSVDSMVEQSKCILTTVGPYQLYGSNILKNGNVKTHRIDSEILLSHVLKISREKLLITENSVSPKKT